MSGEGVCALITLRNRGDKTSEREQGDMAPIRDTLKTKTIAMFRMRVPCAK